MMDTTAIFSYLNKADQDTNTVLVLSSKLYENVKYVCTELTGVGLMYEPLATTHPGFLELLATMGITIKCSNQEVLGEVPAQCRDSVVVVSSLMSRKQVATALNQGFSRVMVRDCSDLVSILEHASHPQLVIAADGPGTEAMIRDAKLVTVPLSMYFGGELRSESDVVRVGDLIHSLLDTAKHHGAEIRDISIGVIDDVADVARLKDPIHALMETLPSDISITVEMGQSVIASAIILATKITGKSHVDGVTVYEVDMSMFCEFAGYDGSNGFRIVTQGQGIQATPSRVLGNTGDSDDVIFTGSLQDLGEEDWILLVNAGMADCRDFELVLLDSNYRTLKAVEPMLTLHEAHALESPDLLGATIRVTA